MSVLAYRFFEQKYGIYNPKSPDYGATGNGVTNDGPAIQACIDAIRARTNSDISGFPVTTGATLFFPPGNYLTNQELLSRADTSDCNIYVEGSGYLNTYVHGDVAGYIFRKEYANGWGFSGFNKLHVSNDFNNGVGTGGICFDFAENVYVRDCWVQGFNGIRMIDTQFNNVVESCMLSGAGAEYLGSVGIYGAQVRVDGCSISAWDIGVQLGGIFTEFYNTGSAGIGMRGNRIEVCNYAVIVGQNPDPPSTSGTLGSNPFTTTNGSATVTVHHVAHGLLTNGIATFSGASTFNNVTMNGSFTATRVDADNYTVIAATNANASGSGGGSAVTYAYINVATASVGLHEMTTERCDTAIWIRQSGLCSLSTLACTDTGTGPGFGATGTWSSSGGGTATITSNVALSLKPADVPWTGGTKTVLLDSSPVAGYNIGSVTGTWQSANVFTVPMPVNPGGPTSFVYWSYPVRRGLLLNNTGPTTVRSCSFPGVDCSSYSGIIDFENTTAGNLGWQLPTNRYNASLFTFGRNCNINSLNSMLFAQLPGSVGVSRTASAGDFFYITDGAKSGGGTAAWGDTVQGGGTQLLGVKYNGSVWKAVELM